MHMQWETLHQHNKQHNVQGYMFVYLTQTATSCAILWRQCEVYAAGDATDAG